MSRERIEQRLKDYKAQLDEDARRKRLQSKAYEGAGGMFKALRDAAEADVNMSNASFAGMPVSTCRFSKTPRGFIVERALGRVTRKFELTWEGDYSVFFKFALTEIQDPVMPAKPLNDGQIELKPNYKDVEIEYVYNERAFRSAEECADVILNWILPGPGDFDS